MNSLTKKMRQVAEIEAGRSIEQHLADFNSEQRDIGLMVIGGIRVTGQYAASMSSEAFKALTRFGDEKLFEAFGYTRFADFLDECPYSPMTKAQYYERKQLFDKEGEKIFDFFGELGLSIRKRKLLGKGNVELDGDNAIIRDASGETTVVPISDHARLMEVVTAVVDAKIALQHKVDQVTEKLDKAKAENQAVWNELDTVKASKVAEVASNPHMVARVELGIAFRRLADAAERLSPIEKDQFRDAVLQDVAEGRRTLAAAYAAGRRAVAEPVAIEGENFDEALDNYLDSVDLDNDDELAAAL